MSFTAPLYSDDDEDEENVQMGDMFFHTQQQQVMPYHPGLQPLAPYIHSLRQPASRYTLFPDEEQNLQMMLQQQQQLDDDESDDSSDDDDKNEHDYEYSNKEAELQPTDLSMFNEEFTQSQQVHVELDKFEQALETIQRQISALLYTRNTTRTSSLYLTARFSGTGAIATPLDLAQQSAVANDLLVWNGSYWAPSSSGGGAVVSFGPGSVLAPSIYFTGSPTTGFYQSAANLVDISVSATQVGQFNSNGLYIKKLAVGANTFNASAISTFNATTTAPYISIWQSILTAVDGSSVQTALNIAPTFTPTAGSTTSAAIYSYPTFTIPAAQTVASAYSGIYADAQFASGGAGSAITNLYGVYSTFTNASGVTSVTNVYSGYFVAPTLGTNRCALYADNLSIGYTATAPPTNGVIITGQTVIGANAATAGDRFRSTLASTDTNAIAARGTVTASSDSNAFYAAAVFNPTNGTTTEAGYQANCSYIAPNTMTITNAAGFYVNSTVSANVGTITNLFGVYAAAGSAGAGTITNAYGGYFATPTAGTNKCALYADDLVIGYPGVTPPTNGLMVSGALSIGTSTISVNSTIHFGGSYTLSGLFWRYWQFDTTITVNVGAVTSLMGFWCNPAYVANATVNNIYNARFNCTVTGVGPITNAYSVYVGNPTGASTNVALYTDNIAVGYTATAPPASGAVISGQTAVGASSATAGDRFASTLASTDINAIAARGTVTSSSDSNAFYAATVFNPTNGTSYEIGYQSICSFIAPNTKTITNAVGLYAYNVVSSNVGTITNLFGVYADTGSSAAGTITNAYGGLFKAPTAGTNKYCLQIAGTSSTVAGGNAFRGLDVEPQMGCSSGTLTAAPSIYVYPNFLSNAATITSAYGLWIDSGATAGTITFGTSAYVTMPAYGTNKYGIQIGGTGTVTSSGVLYGVISAANLGCSSGTLGAAYQMYVQPNFTANSATITTAYGLIIDAGSTAGTITNGYGLYVNQPAYGTNKYCAYFEGGVGIGITPPTSAGLKLPTSGGTAATLSAYELLVNTGTWASNGGGGTPSASTVVYTYKIGENVTIVARSFTCTTSGSTTILKFSVTLPSRFWPIHANTYMSIPMVINAGVTQTLAGCFAVDTAGGMYILVDSTGNNFTASSTAGLNSTVSCSYNTG